MMTNIQHVIDKNIKWRNAWIKLLALTEGISIDGDYLSKVIPEYKSRYRLKRNRKCTSLVNGKLLDTITEDVPYIPEELFLHFENGKTSVVKLNYKQDSNIFVECSDDGQLELVHRMGHFRIPCSLVGKPSKETGDSLQILGADRIAILGYEGCSGWLNCTQCKFCDSATKRSGENGIVPNINDLKSQNHAGISKWLDESAAIFFPKLSHAYACAVENVSPHCHVHVMSGNLPELDLVWKYHIELGRVLNKVKPVSETDSYINLLPPDNIELISMAKDIGFKKAIFNMEVWGDEDYRIVCPEKSTLMPMEQLMERMKAAVNIFGHGNVYCGFVLGAQKIDRLKEGCAILSDLGVSCDITVFTPKKGTPWEKKPRPDFDDVAKFSIFLTELLKKNSLTPLYCRLSSRSEVLWELLEDN